MNFYYYRKQNKKQIFFIFYLLELENRIEYSKIKH